MIRDKMPTIQNPTGQVAGNLGMGLAAAVVLVSVLGGLGVEASNELSASFGVLFGGVFQKFNLFG